MCLHLITKGCFLSQTMSSCQERYYKMYFSVLSGNSILMNFFLFSLCRYRMIQEIRMNESRRELYEVITFSTKNYQNSLPVWFKVFSRFERKWKKYVQIFRVPYPKHIGCYAFFITSWIMSMEKSKKCPLIYNLSIY